MLHNATPGDLVEFDPIARIRDLTGNGDYHTYRYEDGEHGSVDPVPAGSLGILVAKYVDCSFSESVNFGEVSWVVWIGGIKYITTERDLCFSYAQGKIDG